MMINNGQNTRSYSPMEVQNMKTSMKEDPKEKLREHLLKQLDHEMTASLIMADLADAYGKMGLEGHKHKFYHKSCKEHKEALAWRDVYMALYDEAPKMEFKYDPMEMPKTLDAVHNKLYELYSKNKENIDEILRLLDEAHMYSKMDVVICMHKASEEDCRIIENKMRSSQLFGYDVAYILLKDDELRLKYRKHHPHYEIKHQESEEK